MDYQGQRVHPEHHGGAQPHDPRRYAKLGETGGDGLHPPPPYRRNVPRYDSKSHDKKGRGCCLKCICCCCCFLFMLIIVIVAVLAYLYHYYDPKPPSYNVEHLDVGAFQFRPDFSLYTEFIVIVKADNPNSKISINYETGSSIDVLYSDSTLCSGNLPDFHQGPNNVTMIKVTLKGESTFGSGLQGALMESRHKKRIPLTIKVRVPVVVVMGTFPLRQFAVLVKCSLVVDSLSPNKKVQILSSQYDINFEA
ncbi:hypothetical protein Scep_011224 [Stephania cephalantha]|uniref:Late embryogenesis abundant protein LEA-2 subgroup domain-containing protein n=1 Tax=Stephania cephalantha TaxID=152367 RepID=A0AAP0P8Q1_9MAGN